MPGHRTTSLRFAALAAVALLVSCGRIIPPGHAPVRPSSPPASPSPPARQGPPVAAGPGTAVEAGVFAGPRIDQMGLAASDAGAALSSFVESCPKLLRRNDASGLTRKEDWQESCAAASVWPRADATNFFRTYLESVRVGAGSAYVTGYYEPEIAGSRTRRPGFEVPVYGMPDDLVRAWPADVPQGQRTGRAPLGRYDANGIFISYYDRAQIEDGVLAGHGLEVAWAADPVEVFFLQIQGSGRVRTPEGEVIRVGYAGQNGHAYTGIGGVMRDAGLLGNGPGQYSGSMQGIMQYIRENPRKGRELMRRNRSWVFFRVLTGDGPLGALEVPVRPRSSVAADPKFVPLGAPVVLTTDRAEANGMWIAQDTGGAIKGANRFDSFWGAGAQARQIAGGMSAKGTAVLFLPKGTIKRHRPR